MQRSVLPEVAEAFADVYKDYEMFGHSKTASDQINFSPSGAPEGRTLKILKFIDGKLSKKPSSVLDMGSGSGAGLIALAHQFPSASIYGFEPNDKPAERQKHLPDNVVSILNQRPTPEKKYDVITLFHVFEHIEDLDELLAFIASALSPKGQLLIQVPYPICGAFDFVIADHIWHFTKKSMLTLLNRAGFSTVYIGNDVIEKELTVLATPGAPVDTSLLYENETQQVLDAVQWLVRYKAFLDGLKGRANSFAIYGTGPAAAWVGHVLGDSVFAYLDDDAARVNSTFNAKPVLSPREIASSMPVIAPFPDYQAQWIAEKNKELNIVTACGYAISNAASG
jgi:SAM-dependent methyltransferase